MTISISGAHTCSPRFAPSYHLKIMNTSVSASSPVVPKAAQIGRRWAELQGARDWDGLLEPLDDMLRGEIVRYGEFVRAAYTSFDFDRRSSSYGSCRFPNHSFLRRSGLPQTGYEVTRLLHAAASGMALTPQGWAGASPSWLSCSSSYIGYVSVCKDEHEIKRLGRRDVVIAYRGTATYHEWLDNFHSTLTHLPATAVPPPEAAPSPNTDAEPMVESGFWRLFTSPSALHCSLQSQVCSEVERIVLAYGGKNEPPLSITVTGHSLGAALAVLTSYEITTSLKDAPIVTVMSFGGPRIGNEAFRRRLEESGSKVLRIVNSNDIVTKVPGFAVDDSFHAEKSTKKRTSMISRWLLSKMGWAYTDVGKELRLSSRQMSNVVTSHDLELYLKLVTGCSEQ